MANITYSGMLNRQPYAQKLEQLECEFLKLEQAPCDVVHRFGPGIYIREVRMCADTYAIGHAQKTEHLNVFIKGRVTMVNGDGTETELVAPLTFVGKPGRKVGYIHEDVIWQNIYATEETDIEKLEAMFLDKSPTWQAHQAAKQIGYTDDGDYAAALEEYGFSHEVARAQSVNESDCIPFPHGSFKVRVQKSNIEGHGLFATSTIVRGEWICPARLGGMRTPAGRFTNHAKEPNAQMVARDGDMYLQAIADIEGCKGGQTGEEITVDYRQVLSLQIQKPSKELL
jgi:hypothetical protein